VLAGLSWRPIVPPCVGGGSRFWAQELRPVRGVAG
jgi:hypothetical protein